VANSFFKPPTSGCKRIDTDPPFYVRVVTRNDRLGGDNQREAGGRDAANLIPMDEPCLVEFYNDRLDQLLVRHTRSHLGDAHHIELGRGLGYLPVCGDPMRAVLVFVEEELERRRNG
jgi:hypothetical protein